ncbi:glutamate--tRNA ligase [Candidatus Cyrtobacter comes]|nr:glutamate--tRNA ligase [Candidatus Cyrtobacter comes]
MSVLVRFAPSPTGFLHVGNIRIALVNWLFAKAIGGSFLLRIDDTDTKRSELRYVEQIKEDLSWLGLVWDDIKFQSKRMDRYDECKDFLIKSRRLYPCYETKEELEVRKKLLLKSKKPPIYDRAALRLAENEVKKLEQEGRRPHWRFFIDHSEKIVLKDEIKGDVIFDPSKISDPILIREDGSMTYIFASVIDDIDFNITHIIRGEDHLSGSAIHANLFKALGAAQMPNFAHIPLMRSKYGEISKRYGSIFGIKSLRESGISAKAIINLLAKLGTCDEVNYSYGVKDLISQFSFKKFSQSCVLYDEDELTKLNEKVMHNMPYKEALILMKDFDFDISEEIWEAAKSNISNIRDILLWKRICQEKLMPKILDIEYTMGVSEILPEEPWDSNTWQELLSKTKKLFNKKGKELFLPIRLALTGVDDGPELQKLLPLIGRKRCYERLRGNES